MIFQEMLNLIDTNKRLPYYAAERRIDLFINFFLENILSQFYGEPIRFVTGEFPLKIEENNQSDKLDYLCVIESTKQPIFVELKTDAISFDINQARNYTRKAAKWSNCIEKLNDIISSKGMRFSYREKYFWLLKRLYDRELIDLREKDITFINTTSIKTTLAQKEKVAFSRNLIDLSRHISPIWKKEAILLYLVPCKEDLKKKIDFACDDKAKILDFQQLSNMKFSSDMPYYTEFQQLVDFLKTL